MQRVVFTADDFGLTESVNEAVERAHREGILDRASLMVAAPAAGNAVQRARRMPSLGLGLHLVVIDGPAMSDPEDIPDLVGPDGRFPADPVRLGFRYSFNKEVQRQLEWEIRMQFESFALTGLRPYHADAHRHMHLHPVVGRLLTKIGREYGVREIRVPAEPPATMRRLGTSVGIGGHALYAWTRILRRQARNQSMFTRKHCFGIAWSGHMTIERVRRLLANLPEGYVEIYCHPATHRDDVLTRLMPDYEHEAEFAALMDRGLLDQLRSA